MKETSLYIHIPFCKQKCFYCDFPSFAGKEKYREDYIEALCKEILDKYNNIAMNIYDKQQNIRYENNDLKIIRDNLLPKLMSGEIILDKKIIIY